MKSLSSKIILVLLLSITSFGIARGQRVYSPGYVLQNKEMVAGLIYYAGFGTQPQFVYYRATALSPEMVYTPEDIDGFFYKEELFVSAKVTNEISPLNLNDVEADSKLKLEKDTVFLMQLIKGNKSLYFYENKAGKEQFYIKVDGGYDLLIHKKYVVEVNGKKVTQENKNYMGQLAVYLGDCPTIASEIIQLEYSKNKFARLFKEYEACMGRSTYESFGKKIKRIELGVTAGVNYTTFKLNEKPFRDFVNLDDVQNLYPSFGVSFKIYLLRNNPKYSLYNEIFFARFCANGHMEHYEGTGKSTISDAEIDLKGINLRSGARYSIPIGAFNAHLTAGASFSLYEFGINRNVRDEVFHSTNKIVTTAAIPWFKLFGLSPSVGLGGSYKNFSLDVWFEKRLKYSADPRYDVDMTKLYFMVGYRF